MSANQKPNPRLIVAASNRITPRAYERLKKVTYVKPKFGKGLKNRKPNPSAIVKAAGQKITPRAYERLKQAVYVKPQVSKGLKDIKQSNGLVDNVHKPPSKPEPQRGR